MAYYDEIKAAIAEAVFTNGEGAVTASMLQGVLFDIVGTFGRGYLFMGVATPETNTTQHDEKEVYIAPAGDYPNFGLSVEAGAVAVFYTESGEWKKDEVVVVGDGVVTGRSIADGAVTSGKLADKAVEGRAIADGAVGRGQIADGAVDTMKIADGAVGHEQLAYGAVTSGKLGDRSVSERSVGDKSVSERTLQDKSVSERTLQDYAVTTPKIAAFSVNGDKIADGAVTTPKVADGAVTERKIADSGVSTRTIDDGAVTEEKIGNGAVSVDKIRNYAVTTDKINNEAVTDAKIAEDAVTTPKIADWNVSTSKIADNAVTERKLAVPIKERIENTYTKEEVYTKNEVNSLVTTPEQQYVTVEADALTEDVTELLPAQGEADTIYRVGKWDGTQYATAYYCEYAWDGAQYVLLAVKQPGIDDEPTPLSSNFVKSGGVTAMFGEYVTSGEWLRVITDRNGHILCGIRHDGAIEWSVGIPTPVQLYVDAEVSRLEDGSDGTAIDGLDKIISFLAAFSTSDTLQALLEGKEDKAEGKALINADFSEGVDYLDSDEYVGVVTDADGRILFGFRHDGGVVFGIGVPSQVEAYVSEKFGHYIVSEEFVRACVDTDGRILFGIRRNGDVYFGAGVPSQVVAAFRRVFTPENKEVADMSGLVDNPEFIHAELDSEGKMLIGMRKDGDVVFGAGIPSVIRKKLSEVEAKADANEEQIAKLQDASGRLTKVVVNDFDAHPERPFYIRARYNDEKDIIITHWINDNGLVSFYEAYVGPNGLPDTSLMSSAYSVSFHSDSTAPLFSATQYWHLFAQHGYPVPYVDNTEGLTMADVGALWQDQLNRQYRIGKVTAERIYLLPVIYQDAGGHDVRDWHSTLTSTAITSLTYVSGGGAGHHSSPITVNGYNQVQLYPIMKHTDRVLYADGKRITEPGTYYCDEFKISESQEGYDPATVLDWFGGEGGKVDLDGAEVMAKFTFSYVYCGAQCSMKTTLDIRREVECASYGAIQQQFFIDKGSYKAMFMLPKAAPQNGVVLDKPFNSPARTSPDYTIYRTSGYLKNVNDPVDRMIGFLYDDGQDEYLVGMAAGLSLIHGETVRERRIANCPVGADNRHYRLGSISPSNLNKFYVAAINTAAYEDEGYYLPATLFKEIDCYVCYFDPAENIGQVYWYKDGGQYVIYCHCQTAQDRIAVNVPPFMEGLSLCVVEQTAGSTLLSDTVQNGKFFLTYTDEANYIVLTAK